MKKLDVHTPSNHSEALEGKVEKKQLSKLKVIGFLTAFTSLAIGSILSGNDAKASDLSNDEAFKAEAIEEARSNIIANIPEKFRDNPVMVERFKQAFETSVSCIDKLSCSDLFVDRYFPKTMEKRTKDLNNSIAEIRTKRAETRAEIEQ